MSRSEFHTDTVKVEQRAPIVGDAALREHDGGVVISEKVMPGADYLEALQFAEEPVTIRLEPSSEKNAPKHYPFWNNGKGCEVLFTPGGAFAQTAEEGTRWMEMTWVPVGVVLTVKRKYVAIMVSAKIDTLMTDVLDRDSDRPNNVVRRFTSPVNAMSVLQDRNPRGVAWLSELRRKNF